MGYDHEKSPVCADTCHELDGVSEDAAKDPVPADDTGAAIATNMVLLDVACGVATRAWVDGD